MEDHSPLICAWSALVGDEPCGLVLRQAASTERETESEEARRCQQQLVTAVRQAADEHCSAQSHAHVVTSVSHSHGWVLCAAALVPDSAGIEKCGVDLEPATRSMSERAIERVIGEEELALGLTPIELWTIKEACYKANPESDGSVVGQYRVRSRGSQDLDGQAVGPRGRVFRYRLFRDDKWCVSFAVSSRPPGSPPA